MVNLKRIACFAETVEQIINEIPLFLFRHVQYAECLKLVIEPRIVSNNFVAPAEMQNSLTRQNHTLFLACLSLCHCSLLIDHFNFVFMSHPTLSGKYIFIQI